MNVLFLDGGPSPARARISCLEQPLGNLGPLEKAHLPAPLAVSALDDAPCGDQQPSWPLVHTGLLPLYTRVLTLTLDSWYPPFIQKVSALNLSSTVFVLLFLWTPTRTPRPGGLHSGLRLWLVIVTVS